jgi:hypothetical protein
VDATHRGVTCAVFLEGHVRGELTTHLSSTQALWRFKRSNDHRRGQMSPVARVIITPLKADGPGAASNPVVALPKRVRYTSHLASRGEEDTLVTTGESLSRL